MSLNEVPNEDIPPHIDTINSNPEEFLNVKYKKDKAELLRYTEDEIKLMADRESILLNIPTGQEYIAALEIENPLALEELRRQFEEILNRHPDYKLTFESLIDQNIHPLLSSDPVRNSDGLIVSDSSSGYALNINGEIVRFRSGFTHDFTEIEFI
jgi:hypothetical protein